MRSRGCLAFLVWYALWGTSLGAAALATTEYLLEAEHQEGYSALLGLISVPLGIFLGPPASLLVERLTRRRVSFFLCAALIGVGLAGLPLADGRMGFVANTVGIVLLGMALTEAGLAFHSRRRQASATGRERETPRGATLR